MAAGLHTPISAGFLGSLQHRLTVYFLKASFDSALFIGTHDPKAVGGNIGNVAERFRIRWLPIPFDTTKRLEKLDRRKLLSDLFYQLGGLSVPETDYVLFVPSRVDFLWKGTDLLIKAFENLLGTRKLHLIISGWGNDYKKARQMLTSQHVTFLPCALSRPLLRDLLQAVDLVADQFFFGTYGTTLVEAMSCGTPVLTWIDQNAFEQRGWKSPPVLNANDEAGIRQILADLVEDKIDLEQRARSSLDWARELHSREVVTSLFENTVLKFDESVIRN